MSLSKQTSGWRAWLGLVRTWHLLVFLGALTGVLGLVSLALISGYPMRPWWVNAIALVCFAGSMAIDGQWQLMNRRLRDIYQAHLHHGSRSPRAARLLSMLGIGLVVIYFWQVIRLV